MSFFSQSSKDGPLLPTLSPLRPTVSFPSSPVLPKLGITHTVSHVFSGGPSSTTVTITPKSVDAHNTYVITGVTGTPDSTKRQVEVRMLSSASQPQSKTVSATGVVNTPGVRATGTLTFTNGAFSPYGVSA